MMLVKITKLQLCRMSENRVLMYRCDDYSKCCNEYGKYAKRIDLRSLIMEKDGNCEKTIIYLSA